MDRQEATLRDELVGTGVTIDRLGQQIRVSKVLTTFEKTVVDIAVHTDSTAGDRINLPLSERRADSVASYLRTQKVDPRRMASFGMGSKQPVASNDYVAGRERNRRVEIILTLIVAPPLTATEQQTDLRAGLADPPESPEVADTSPGADVEIDDDDRDD